MHNGSRDPTVADQAGDSSPPASATPGVVREFANFAWRYKIFWLIPVAIVVAAIVILRYFSYSFAPFHYTVM
jgi:hypothetical protein